MESPPHLGDVCLEGRFSLQTICVNVCARCFSSLDLSLPLHFSVLWFPYVFNKGVFPKPDGSSESFVVLNLFLIVANYC